MRNGNDRWSEHRIRPSGAQIPAAIALAAVTVVISVVSMVGPVGYWLAAGASPQFDFQVWRPLLFALSGGSILQAVINAAFLILVGHSLEPMLGSIDFAVVYLLAGLGGATALSVTGVAASLSGSICGVFGILAAMAVIKYLQHQDIRGDIILIALLVIWGILAGSRDWTAGIGAVVVGALVGWVWNRARWASRTRVWLSYAAVALVCLVVLVLTWMR
ncbi:rhomboid family intramembrane serine protease [Acidipropionibacterium jensenii]|uniref:Rhomboid family intramembrane serine protease n=1 Tax=Acidipropionibacterium jensenii TaxID=1749 RepID=A0A3T0S0C4_9ACTN|nr:rhomboid family intramembrane serine protease [Acidipropionibacterium jensenii]AZZ39816.1 rhomboid family intramembrane serine protease [Acidipropionibacterium jensenii]